MKRTEVGRFHRRPTGGGNRTRAVARARNRAVADAAAPETRNGETLIKI